MSVLLSHPNHIIDVRRAPRLRAGRRFADMVGRVATGAIHPLSNSLRWSTSSALESVTRAMPLAFSGLLTFLADASYTMAVSVG